MAATNGNGNGNGYTRFGFWASIIVAGITIVGAIALVASIGFQANSNTKDIQIVRDDMRKIEARQEEIAAFEAKTCQEFAKVETQFGTVETIINQLRVDDLRTRGLTWPKIFNQSYPDVFYEIKIPHELESCLR